MQNPTILTVGSMAFDSLRTPAGTADQVLGGSANYFSVAASLYSKISLLAVVGEDFPTTHLDWLKARDIDVSGVEIAAGKTFHWVGEYDQNMNEAKTLSTALNVFEAFQPKLSAEQKDAEYAFLGNIDPVLQISVLDQMKQPRWIALDSMNFWIAGKLDELKKTLKRVDLLSINEGEAYLLSNQKNLVKAAEVIREMGPKVVIIKRGEYGAALVTPSGIFLTAAYPVGAVIDPTGAGDSFAGAVMGYLAAQGFSRDWLTKDPHHADETLRRAVLHGCVMASFTVEDFSLRRLMTLSSDEFELRLRTFHSMIHVH